MEMTKENTMGAKNTAYELFEKMYSVDNLMGRYPMCFETAKKCALIAVDEILKLYYHLTDEFKYWQEVRLEISKL